jgi:hypothetical protein
VNWVTDFFVPLAVNMVGVFVGVVLALWTDRRRQEVADARAARRLSVEFAGLREVVLSSVVKDTIEATRVKASLASRSDPFLLEVYLELAVWEAAQSQFVRHAPLDDRILLSRFFDQVRRLARLLDFYREILAEHGLDPDEAAARACENIAIHVAEVAEDVRLDGVVIVMDHGDETQKRFLGLL